MIQILKDGNDDKIITNESEVIKCLNLIKMWVTRRQGRISGNVWKECKLQLSPAIT